jgi:hypothetical protein
LEPDSELDPEPPDPDLPMFGQGCPGAPCWVFGAGVVFDCVEDVLGVVDCVLVVVDVVEEGAAEAPASPATAPPVARAQTTIPALMNPALFIRPPMVGGADTNHPAGTP